MRGKESKSTPTTKSTTPKMGRKAASLIEAGMILGLIAVSAIGAVFVAGDTVKEVFCENQSALERSMGWGEGTCISDGTEGGGNPGGGGGEGSGGGNPGGGGGEGSGGGTPPGVDYSGMDLSGATYPARTTGNQNDLTALPVGHGGGQNLSLVDPSGADVAVCYQTDPLQAAVCGATVTLPAGAVTVGWQASLPADVRAAFARTFTVRLHNGGTTLREWADIAVQRTQAANWLELLTDFPAIVYPAGTFGTQTHMQPLAGVTTPTMTLSVPADESSAPCWQATAGDPVVCGAAGGSVTVTGTAYAIGFRANDLPTDPRAAFATTSTLNLASTLEPNNPITWAIPRSRPTTAIQLVWNTVAQPLTTFPVGTLTESYAMYPLSGTFNGPMRLEFGSSPTWAGSPSLCYQIASETPTCFPNGTSWSTQRHTIPANTTAIGFRHAAADFPTNLKGTWGGSAQVTLTSTLDGAFTQTQTLSVTRTQESIVFEPTFPLTTATWQVYSPPTTSNSTWVYNMVPLAGTFNDPLTLRASQHGSTSGGFLQVCKQVTSSSPVTCSSTDSLSVAPTDYAIGTGYQYTGGTYATSNQPTFTLEATNDTAQNVTFSPRMERVPQTIATNERNFSVTRTTTGPVNAPTSRSTWTGTASGNRFFRRGVNEQARITVLSNDGPVTVRLCTYSNGSSSGNINLMCNSSISAVGATSTRAIGGISNDMWLQYDSFGAAGTARNISVQIEIWNTIDPTATMRTYTVNMARGS